MQVTKIARKT